MENNMQKYQNCRMPISENKQRGSNANGSLSNVMKLFDTTLLIFTLLIFIFLPTGCNFLDADEVFKPKTRTALFTIAPTLRQVVVTHPDNAEVTYTSYYMIVTEDGTVEPIMIYRIDGLTYEEGYIYRVKIKVISEPRVDDMILTGQRKSDWGIVEYCHHTYELIEVLSKTKVND